MATFTWMRLRSVSLRPRHAFKQQFSNAMQSPHCVLMCVQGAIRPYMLLQGLGDAVVIPAGCAHQVVNLRSSIKIATDFVSCENIRHTVSLSEERRLLSPTHHRYIDVLNVNAILFDTACACLLTLRDVRDRRRGAPVHGSREHGARQALNQNSQSAGGYPL